MIDSLDVLDSITLNFSPESIVFMNITLAIIMFGVALDLKMPKLKKTITSPKSIIIGALSQFFFLPFVTFLFLLILKPSPGVALGMILVASCPGGNISNFISSLAKANTELSISLTAVATISAIFMTPLNFAFWGGLYNASTPLLRPIEIDAFQMFQTVFIILGIPLIFGIWFSSRFKKTTEKIKKPIKIASIFIFIGFVLAALTSNFSYFIEYIDLIFIIVLLHNTIAFTTGYSLATVFKLPYRDRKTITVETGIQNSGLALALIFNPKIFPPDLGLGGMAFIAAWWGIWHIIAGLSLASIWSNLRILPKFSFFKD